MNWKRFSEDPFKFVDGVKLVFLGNNLNFFQKYKRLQKTAFYGALVCLVCWIVFGFDSTPVQFIHVLYEGVLQGVYSVEKLGHIYTQYYGKEMHYSAFVIYGLLFYALSKTWEKVGIVKSKNVAFSVGATALSIAVFEWYWMLSYAHFQNQSWVATWMFPQMRILLQNAFFSVVGCLCCLYMLTERWNWKGRIQLNRAYFFRLKTLVPWMLICFSVAAGLLWIYYPFNVKPVSVTLESGEVWHNSKLFPQTLYTIDVNPDDSINAGVWFYVEDNLVHGVNTGVKALWALTTFYIFRVRKPCESEL